VFAPYRIVYLGIACGLAGAVVLVSAALEPEEKAPKLSIGLRSVQEAKDKQAAPVSAPNDGTEKGNLKEAGAREIFSVADYERAVALSRTRPVLIFKHSTECTVSGGAYRRLSEWLKREGRAAPPVFVVKVIERRPVSQEIASRVRVEHESPQVILLDRAKPVWNADHEAITGESVGAALAALAHRGGTH
jgi:bacillithiol system protein YtxJ